MSKVTTTYMGKPCISQEVIRQEIGLMMLLKYRFMAIFVTQKDIKKAYEAFQNRGEIDTVVGHSLGGSVSLELQKNFSDRIKHSRTYGAPVMDLMGSDSASADRYRHWLDPFSVFDRRGV